MNTWTGRTAWIVAVGAAAALLGGITPVSAASSTGAEVTHDAGCEQTPDGTVCSTHHVTANAVETPSGNTSVVFHFRSTLTLTASDGHTEKGTSRYQDHQVLRQGEPQTLSMRHFDSITIDGYTCTYAMTVHYANGQVQFDDFERQCD